MIRFCYWVLPDLSDLSTHHTKQPSFAPTVSLRQLSESNRRAQACTNVDWTTKASAVRAIRGQRPNQRLGMQEFPNVQSPLSLSEGWPSHTKPRRLFFPSTKLSDEVLESSICIRGTHHPAQTNFLSSSASSAFSSPLLSFNFLARRRSHSNFQLLLLSF